MKPINIILLGDPAAGKATQAAYLAKRFKLFDFDMGKELGHRRTADAKLNAVLKNNTDKGNLTPTAIVRDILRTTITEIASTRGILFDGHPKMLGEAKLVARMLKSADRMEPLVMYISIPMDEMVKRMHNREGYFKGKFGKRADDSDTALKNRMKYYRVNIAQVIEFFSSKYMYHKISGMGTREEVQKRIDTVIANYIQEHG